MPENIGWTVVTTPVNDAPRAEQVRALAASAQVTDRVGALSEHSLMHLDTPGSRHCAVLDGGSAAGGVDGGPLGDGSLVGYAQVWADGASELVVDPGHRRRGVGTALWEAAVAEGATRVWSHGDLPSGRAFAAAQGLLRVRELHKMSRTLTAADTAPVDLPAWLSVETFAQRGDPQEWVDLNAAAFAGHPEQGRLNRADFEARAAESWFDPEGLFYLLDENAPADAPPIAFHWTKVEPASSEAGRNAEGEVYVVGVHPAYQGRGLAGPLTRLGIAHLAGLGLGEVVLYVDGDNVRALNTYRRAGFRTIMVDVVHAEAAATSSAETVRMDP